MNVDHILNGLNPTPAEDYIPLATGTERCWRCRKPAGNGPTGICQPCRETLLAEEPDPLTPPEELARWVTELAEHDWIR